MQIAFVNANRKWGGVKTWTLDFGRALLQRGHGVVAVVRANTPFEAACRSAGFRVHVLRFGGKYDPLAIWQLTQILRRERAQVVVANISKDLEVGGVAARLLRLPLLHRVGLVEDYRGTREERWRHRLLVTRILVPAFWMREALLQRFSWLQESQVESIPNSKKVRDYPLAKGGGGAEVVFGAASQLSPSKGHRYLFDALRQLREENLPIHLCIAGTGRLEADLKRQVGELGLGNAVTWEGFVGNIPGFLSRLDGFVLPSLKEGFPNTLLEALCAGLPTVSFDIPGAREMVGDAGLLVSPADSGALAASMARLISDASLRTQLGGAARARAEEQFDVERNAVRLEKLLQELVAGSGRA